LSRDIPDSSDLVSPREFVRLAWAYGCQGTSLSFNEPTLSLEWALDMFPHAREAGLYNTFVTNGSMTEIALRMLAEDGLDAMSVDLKGDAETVRRHCRLDSEVVWRNCRLARQLGVWIELATLVVPGVNDDAELLAGIARRIVRELGAGTPWHVNRYVPAHRFSVPATPRETLVRARAVGRQAGLRHVYIGNLGDVESGNTDCPSCGTRLITRRRMRLGRSDVTATGCCPRCGETIEGVGWDRRAEDDKVVRFRSLHSAK
jgi:pyruvate formate lyase activating enzyme